VAVKVVRQPNKIALLGVPTSAAAMSAGHEAAPSALRTAGLIERLKSIGYEVTDLGDDPPQLYKPDEESPRARNLPSVIAALEALKPRVEQAVKSGALPLILSGDCSVALATVAGARRYFRNVSLIYVDRDADINVPATTPSGCVDGMVVAHLTGRGAAELVRFWGEPPLVREPDLALFGTDRIDPSEEEALQRSTLRRYSASDVKRMGAAAAARIAIERTHSNGHEFILHFDVDVIADFQATNYPGSGGLTLDEVREALEVFAQEKNLAAIEVTAYNPAKDSDGNGAKIIIDLLAGVLEKRLELLKAAAPAIVTAAQAGATQVPAATAPPATEPASEPEAESAAPELPIPPAAPGEAWSSDSLGDESSASEELPEAASESGESPS
jgi:arginase